LVSLLAFFGGLCTGARGFGFGFLLPRRTLGVGFILLGLALFDYVVATGQGSANLFGFTFNTLNGAPDRFLWSALLIPHGSTSLSVVAELALIWMRIGLVSCRANQRVRIYRLPTPEPVKRRPPDRGRFCLVD
jgi:hypothetical protein